MTLSYFGEKKRILGGILTGLVNGLLGAGGGMIAVPALESTGLDAKQAHSGAIAVILPLSFISAAYYWHDGRVALSDALPYIPAGLAGAWFGAHLMQKISPIWLHRLFGGFAIWTGLRMLLR